ncbi:MAG: GNAT family N-acetyltransferase [Bacteroidota bacterium]
MELTLGNCQDSTGVESGKNLRHQDSFEQVFTYLLHTIPMKPAPLSDTSFDELLACFLQAFEGYFVPMPTDPAYYQQRWKAAKVNFDLSYGMFDEGKLVGFMIHAVDKRNGSLTAFNTGTGVLPEYRGQRMVQAMYDFALTDLQRHGIRRSTLEVITENQRAIRAYKQVGFSITKHYQCFAGEIQAPKAAGILVREKALEGIDWGQLPDQAAYSWDFQAESLLGSDYRYVEVGKAENPESYFFLHPQTHRVAQLGVIRPEEGAWERLFAAIHQFSPTISIINVEASLHDKLSAIRSVGLKNTVNQYEMERVIG